MLEKADELVELLLAQYLNGELSPAETERLQLLISNSAVYANLYNDLSKPGKLDGLSKEYFRYIETFVPLETGKATSPKGRLIRSKFFWRLSAAACVFLVLTIGAYFWFSNSNTPEKSLIQTPIEKPADLLPGQNKAVLILADGKRIVLDSTAIGQLAQGNTIIVNKEGHITYNGADATTGKELYNTLSTGKGEIYSLVLADRTRVWLNASSSIRFPVAFGGAERKVLITGEVYFEVAHNKAMPFKVHVVSPRGTGINIEVLGTSFNVNSYPDEGTIKTTLLEGSVKVTARMKGKPQLLAPGQQAQAGESDIRVIGDVDVQQAIAWKNGYFQFNRDDLPTVMRQIAMWYDVEVVYEGDIPKREFWGKIHRNTKASEVLKILERYGIHFRIEGKKIIVTP